MRVFSRKSDARAGQGATYDQIANKLDAALESIFTQEGKRTVLFFLAQNYSLTLEDASADPARLEAALTNLLGEIGWQVVRKKILEQFQMNSMGVVSLAREQVHLSDVFGAFRFLPKPAFMGP